MLALPLSTFFFFFFNDTATTEIYTLSLHDALPIRPRLLAGDLVAHALHEDLAAAAGNRVETSRHQLPDDRFDRHAEPAREEVDLRGREAVDVDRVVALDVAQQIEIPLERDVGVVSALHQNLHAADCLELVDLAADFLERQQVPLGMFGAPIERAELAVGDADVRVIDVSVDDVRDDVLGMQLPPDVIRELAQLEQRGALVELEVRPEFGTGAIDHQATCTNCGVPARRRKSVSAVRCWSLNA